MYGEILRTLLNSLSTPSDVGSLALAAICFSSPWGGSVFSCCLSRLDKSASRLGNHHRRRRVGRLSVGPILERRASITTVPGPSRISLADSLTGLRTAPPMDYDAEPEGSPCSPSLDRFKTVNEPMATWLATGF
jgi:hypothetical protein